MNAKLLPDWRLFLTLIGSSLMIAAATAAEPAPRSLSPSVPGLVQYQTPQGIDYAALVLPARAISGLQPVPHDHVVIIDTSASQSGSFRTRSIAVAAEVCRTLPASDRVRLIATDVTTEELTSDFVPAGSPDLQVAFDRFEDRVPLGSSNVELALRTALQKFTGDRARSVLYIGDGFSTAQLIQTPAMRKLVTDLRSASVPVSSLAIGPRTDLLLLGSLAQHTGGVVVVDESNLVAERDPQAGDLQVVAGRLAKAAIAPVFYPTSITTEPEIPSLLPQVLPPVRFDRETILLGKDVFANKVEVKLTGTIRGKARELSWVISDEVVDGSTGFVGQAWALAENSEGLAMPWAGRSLMVRSQEAYQAQLETLTQAGAVSLSKKDSQQADQIAQVLQQLDPSNLDAPVLLQASRRLQAKSVKRQWVLAQAEDKPAEDAKPDEKSEGEAPAPIPAEGAPIPADQVDAGDDKSNPKSDSLLDELETKRKVREEQLTIDVNLAIEQAHQDARESYQDAQEILKRQLDTVVAATDISAEVRQALRKRLEVSTQQLMNESEQFEQQRAALDRKLSQQEAMKKLMEQTQRDEEKMEQLIDRVRALLNRGFKGNPDAFEDAEAVSRVAVELAPYSGVPNLDVFNSEAAGALDKARRLRSLRYDKFLALLNEVELSHVPFPDEPPIVWPSPERWQWITENRRKWKSMDLKSYSKKEEKIVQELDKPTTFDFTDESLDGVRETIMERHGFDIVIDKTKLEEESVATDATDITLKVNEISLKNALKLLLDSKNLTYVIENEVMKITTKTDGILKRPLRVYNVGDLVMPINPLFGMGGSSTGGQTGGGGQFGGGQQGGGGQFGGGGQGFGGGGGGIGIGIGGGGGVFNIPPEKTKPQPPAARKVTQLSAVGQAFAQVQDNAAQPPKLTRDTLKDRKKKVPERR